MIVLDTHILIWWVDDPKKLSTKAYKLVEEEYKKGEILISSISIWEIYMLVKKGRLKFNMEVDGWVEKISQITSVSFVPIDNQIASKSVNLEKFSHSDPADRIIIATALILGAILITSDKRILSYKSVKTVW